MLMNLRGNVSVSKRVLEEVNSFDENFGLKWGCEDVELGYCLMKKRIPFIYLDDAINYHIPHYRVNFVQEHKVNSNYSYEKYHDESILLFHEFISRKISGEELIKKILLIDDVNKLRNLSS